MAELTDADLNKTIEQLRSSGLSADQANQLVLGGEDDKARFPAIEEAMTPTAPFPLISTQAVNKDYEVQPTDDVVIVDSQTAPLTITLPPVEGAARRITVKKVDATANSVTVTTTGSDTIDTAGSVALAAQHEFVTIVSDLVNWWVV